MNEDVVDVSSVEEDIDIDAVPDFHDVVSEESLSPPAEAGSTAMPGTPATPVVPPSAPQAATPTPQPVQAPAAQPQAQAAKPAQQVSAPPPATAVPPQPAVPAKTQEQVNAEVQQNRKAALDHIAKGFQLTQEHIDGLTLNPEETLPTLLPTLAAQATLASFEMIAAHMQQALPVMIENIVNQLTERRASQEENDKQFYGMWPLLKKDDPTHAQVLGELSHQWLKVNGWDPSKKDAFFREVGALASLRLELPLTMGAGGQPAVAQPAAPPPARTPHRPIAPGLHSPTAQPTAKSVFDELLSLDK